MIGRRQGGGLVPPNGVDDITLRCSVTVSDVIFSGGSVVCAYANRDKIKAADAREDNQR